MHDTISSGSYFFISQFFICNFLYVNAYILALFYSIEHFSSTDRKDQLYMYMYNVVNVVYF